MAAYEQEQETYEQERDITEQEREAVCARRIERTRRRKVRQRRRWLIGGGAAALAVFGLVVWQIVRAALPAPIDLSGIECPDWIDQELLDIDGQSRDGRALEQVNDIAIHYVGNPGSTAIANRNYFNKPEVEVSSHFIVGLDGEIVQCIPLNERAVATNDRNGDTIAIEVCHPDDTGQFSDKTYASLIKLTAWLCEQLHLDGTHLIRHYDVTGKLCPLYYVEHEDAWTQLKADVDARIAADTAQTKTTAPDV